MEIVELQIKTTLGMIEDEVCEICGGPTRKELIPFVVEFNEAGQKRAIQIKVPSYVCQASEISSYHLGASVEALEAAEEFLRGREDTLVWERITASLEAGRELQKLYG